MNKDYSQYPGLDWSGCLERTGNNTKLTTELLEMFFNSVPAEHAVFKEAYAVKNYTALKDQAHRMRGALAYCVIPNLEIALQLLEEAAAKQDRERVAKFYAVVMTQLKKYLPEDAEESKPSLSEDEANNEKQLAFEREKNNRYLSSLEAENSGKPRVLH